MALMTPTVQSNPTLNYINNTPTPNRNIPNSSRALVNYNLNKVGQIFNAVTQIQQQRMAVEAKAIANDEFNQLHSAFQNEVNNILSQQGKNAIKARKGLEDRLTKIYQEKSKNYKNYPPIISDAINQSYKSLELKSIASADSYVMQETVKYNLAEKAKLLENKEQDVLNVYSNDALRKQGMADLELHLDDYLINDLGIEKDSEQYKAKFREVKTSVHAKAIKSMIDFKQWGQANNALNKAKDDMEYVTYNELKSRIWRAQQAEINSQKRQGIDPFKELKGQELYNALSLWKDDYLKEENNRFKVVDGKKVAKTEQELNYDAENYALNCAQAHNIRVIQYQDINNLFLEKARINYRKNKNNFTSYEDMFDGDTEQERMANYMNYLKSGGSVEKLQSIIDSENLQLSDLNVKHKLENEFIYNSDNLLNTYQTLDKFKLYLETLPLNNEDRKAFFIDFQKLAKGQKRNDKLIITDAVKSSLKQLDIDYELTDTLNFTYDDEKGVILGNAIQNLARSYLNAYSNSLKENEKITSLGFLNFLNTNESYLQELNNLVEQYELIEELLEDYSDLDPVSKQEIAEQALIHNYTSNDLEFKKLVNTVQTKNAFEVGRSFLDNTTLNNH